jgi:hypothetical protein
VSPSPQSSTHLATTSSNSTDDIGDTNTALPTIATDSAATESETMPQSTICQPVPDIAESVIVVTEVCQITEISEIADNASESFAGNDIFSYSGRRLKRQDITECLLKGPWQPLDYKFPATDGRSFQVEWFKCATPDGTIRQRSWLSYSKASDKAYCLPCILFSGPRGSDVWTTSGFNN